MADDEPIVPGPKPSPAGRAPLPPEDEDLFDFPPIEMRPSPAKPKAPQPARVAAGASADAALVARAAKALEKEDLFALSGIDPALAAHAPETHRAADALIAAAGRDVDARGPGRSATPATPARAEAASARREVPAGAPADAVPPRRAYLVRGSIAAVAVLVAAQFLVALLSWSGQREDRSRIEELRRELALATHGLAGSNVRARGPAGADAPRRTEPALPLEAFEERTLELARAEIADGSYGAARARLYRLLCVADRVDADRRERIEGEAAFLIAESWRATPRAEGRP